MEDEIDSIVLVNHAGHQRSRGEPCPCGCLKGGENGAHPFPPCEGDGNGLGGRKGQSGSDAQEDVDGEQAPKATCRWESSKHQAREERAHEQNAFPVGPVGQDPKGQKQNSRERKVGGEYRAEQGGRHAKFLFREQRDKGHDGATADVAHEGEYEQGDDYVRLEDLDRGSPLPLLTPSSWSCREVRHEGQDERQGQEREETECKEAGGHTKLVVQDAAEGRTEGEACKKAGKEKAHVRAFFLGGARSPT